MELWTSYGTYGKHMVHILKDMEIYGKFME